MKSKKTIYWGIACITMISCFLFVKKNKESKLVESSIYQAQLDDFKKENLLTIEEVRLSKNNDIQKVIKQGVNKREFIENKFRLLNKFSVFSIENLSRARILDANVSEFIVYDNSDGYIKRVSLNSESLKAKVIAGNGKGRGPGEIGTGFDGGIKDSVFYISDYKNMKVSLYEYGGDHINDITIKNAGRLFFIDDSIININLRDDKLFHIYRYDSVQKTATKQYEKGAILENQAQVLNVLDGFTFTNDSINKLYYSFMYLGYYVVAEILPNKNFQYKMVETIGHPGYIAGIGFYKSGSRMIDNSVIVSYGIGANDDEVFIISGITKAEDDTFHSVVDIYDSDSNQYKHSITVPGVHLYVKPFNEGVIFYDSDDTIMIYGNEKIINTN